MNILCLALKSLAPKAWAFEKATKDPVKAQTQVLFEYLARNKDTEYGRKYNFAGIKSIKDYQSQVPISDSSSLYPYIDRMTKGERNILTSDDMIFFGVTSGTTSKKKLIPVTEYSRAKKAEVADLWAYYISRDHPNILDGKVLAIISAEVEGKTESGLPYGAESGHGYRNLPWMIKRLYVLPPEIFDIYNYDARYYCILRLGMECNVTTVATLNPSALVLLCQKIDMWKEKIINDIEKGTLDKALEIPPEIRKKLEKTLKPNPERARELRNILKDKGHLIPKDFWPELVLIECWKGGTVKLYLRELPQYFGDTPIRDFGYLSTEARSSIPMSDEGTGGVLAIKTNFYEFVPKEDMGKARKRFLLCNEVEKGKEYFMVVTTPGGLYRYNIDDIVAIDGFFNKTPMVEFIQKGLHAMSVTGEKIYESQIDEAVNRAVEKHKVLIKFFTASVQFGDPARYIFLVEFDSDGLTRESKKGLLRSMEEELCLQNSEYNDIRRQQLLGSPILKVVKNGGFDKYKAGRIAEGAHDGQFKVPELIKDSDFQKNFEIEEEIYID